MLKYTADDSPDKESLPKVIAIVKEFLERVNVESGKTENAFNLMQLNEQLVFRPNEIVVCITCLSALHGSDIIRRIYASWILGAN